MNRLSLKVHEYVQKVSTEAQELIWQYGHFRVERALRESYIANLESLVNEMQQK